MTLVSTARPGETRLLVLLPQSPVDAPAECHWWQVRGPALIASGVSSDWQGFAADPDVRTIGLAPISSIRIAFPQVSGDATAKQQLTLARLAALDGALAEPDTLHASATVLETETDGPVPIAAVAGNDVLLGWLEWAERHGATLHHIVPGAMILPFGKTWTAAAIGNDSFVGRIGAVLPDEPPLRDLMVDGEVDRLGPEAVEAALVRLAQDPRPDLRSGRFARRRILIDRSKWKLIAALAAAIAVVTILSVLVAILKLERATDRLDSETLAIAQRVGGPGVTLETAEAAMMRGAAAPGRVSSTLARLLSAISSQPGSSVQSVNSTGPNVSAVLSPGSAQRAAAIAQSLQRDGYRVTLAPDGAGAVLIRVGEPR